MNSLKQYIVEKFQVGKDYKHQYVYTPKDKKELIECINNKIEKEGLGTKDKPLDLNDIDTSEITDMSFLFSILHGNLVKLSENGNFDISGWDVSKVTNMRGMFTDSCFDGDISDWDVSNVKNMNGMFFSSTFTGENGNLNNWDVSGVENMRLMFFECPLQKNPPKWYKD